MKWDTLNEKNVRVCASGQVCCPQWKPCAGVFRVSRPQIEDFQFRRFPHRTYRRFGSGPVGIASTKTVAQFSRRKRVSEQSACASRQQQAINILRPVQQRLRNRVRCTTFAAPGSRWTQTGHRRKSCRIAVLLRVCRNTSKELQEPSPFPTTPWTFATAATSGPGNTTLKPVEHSVVRGDVGKLTLTGTAVHKTAAVVQAKIIDWFTPPHALKEETMKQTTNLSQMHREQHAKTMRDGDRLVHCECKMPE